MEKKFEIIYLFCSVGSCPNGWRLFQGQCYQFNVNNPKTWTDARHYCEAQGSYLITIRTWVSLLEVIHTLFIVCRECATMAWFLFCFVFEKKNPYTWVLVLEEPSAISLKGPYADHILIPQGSTGSSIFFDTKWKPIFFWLQIQNFSFKFFVVLEI